MLRLSTFEFDKKKTFLIMRCDMKVIKIYTHYTFEQNRFKRDFVTMDQNRKQNAKNAIEKDFYKLLNNANFGLHYRNNVNNVKFVPIIDEISEISVLKKYYDLYDLKISSFVTSNLSEQEIEHNFQQQFFQVKHDNPFRNARITALESQNREDLDALGALKKKERRCKKKEPKLPTSKQNWKKLSKIKKIKS